MTVQDHRGRSPRGIEHRRAYNRARQRAKTAMVRLYPEEAAQLRVIYVARYKAHAPGYQRGQQRVANDLVNLHREAFHAQVQVELAKERQ